MWTYRKVFLLGMMIMITCPVLAGIPKHCFEGTYQFTPPGGGKDVCELCPPGMFMPDHDHSYRSCFNCTHLKDPTLERLISPCNRTHNAVIHCIDGYYRRVPRNPNETETCVKCTQCQYSYYQVRPCQTYENTICCPGENFDTYIDKDGTEKCQERRWICRKGQYFDLASSQCLPCSAGTYMSLDYHAGIECSKCQYSSNDSGSLLPLHAVIIQPCNSTHADIIGCEHGYFLNQSMGYHKSNIGCSPCTDCNKTKDSFHDAACCQDPIMTTVDNTDATLTLTGGHQTTFELDAAIDEQDHKNKTSGKDCLESGQETCSEESQTLSPVESDCEHEQSGKILYQVAVVCLSILCSVLAPIVCYQHYKKRSIWTDICHTLPFVNPNGKGRAEADDDNDERSVFLDIVETLQDDPNELTMKANIGKHDNIDDIISSTDAHGILRQLVASDQGCHDMEICYGDVDRQLSENKSTCRKKSSHHHSILVADFDKQHVHDDQAVVDLIKAVASLTVQVNTTCTSKNRPSNYPWHKLGGITGFTRFGCGMVKKVIRKFTDSSENRCPCPDCKSNSLEAKSNWGEFQVVTSTSLVYNDEECLGTKCKVEINHNRDNVVSLCLKGVKIADKNEYQDTCIMHCITHDPMDSEAIENMVFRWESLQDGQYHQNISNDVNLANKIAIISYPHGQEKCVTLGEVTGHQKGLFDKLKYDAPNCPGSCGAPVCVLGKIQSSCYPVVLHSKENESGGFWFDDNACLHSEPKPVPSRSRKRAS